MRFFYPPTFPDNAEKNQNAGLLHRIIITSWSLPILSAVIAALNPALIPFVAPTGIALAITLLILMAVNRAGMTSLASAILTGALIAVFTYLNYNAAGTPRPLSLLAVTAIMVGGLLLGSRGPIISALLLSVQHILIVWLNTNGVILSRTTIPGNLQNAVVTSVSYILIGFLLYLAISRIQSGIIQLRESESNLLARNRELQVLSTSLEQRVTSRTNDLEKQNKNAERRSRQFEAITRVTQTISATRNLQKALPQIANVISEQFGFYHVGIFLNDSANQYAVLSAANSEGGKLMLARGHQLKIGEQGIVGYTISTNSPRIALDVGVEAAYFNNLELPETHSEMALPLRNESGVIGALDVQSTERNAFSDEDIEVLSTLANQVSLAIENARIFDQSQKTLAEAESITRQYLRETWDRLPKETRIAGYKYSLTGVQEIEDTYLANQDKILSSSEKNRVSYPILLRGETIGTLSVRVPKDTRINTDQTDLIKAVAERVAFSAENARLFDETQKRSVQMETLNELGRNVSQQIELKSVLLAAYEQLKRIIKTDTYIVALRDEDRSTIKYPIVIEDEVSHESKDVPPLASSTEIDQVMAHGKPMLIQHTQQEYVEKLNKQDQAQAGVIRPSASLIYAPLIIGNNTMGVLSIQSHEINAYTQDQVSLVENIANQLSIAIQNARLFEETTRRAERERAISEISSKISTSVRTESILKTAAHELSQYLDGADIIIKLQAENDENRGI